eukprot:358614-Chlamydomonas_euryale.AAC.9
MGRVKVNGTAWSCKGCMGLHGAACTLPRRPPPKQLPPPPPPTQAASPDQAAIPPPPPLPADPPHLPATSKGWNHYDGLGKPFCTSAGRSKRSTQEHLLRLSL